MKIQYVADLAQKSCVPAGRDAWFCAPMAFVEHCSQSGGRKGCLRSKERNWQACTPARLGGIGAWTWFDEHHLGTRFEHSGIGNGRIHTLCLKAAPEVKPPETGPNYRPLSRQKKAKLRTTGQRSRRRTDPFSCGDPVAGSNPNLRLAPERAGAGRFATRSGAVESGTLPWPGATAEALGHSGDRSNDACSGSAVLGCA